MEALMSFGDRSIEKLIMSVEPLLHEVLYFPFPRPVKVFDSESSDLVASQQTVMAVRDPSGIRLAPPSQIELSQIIQDVIKEIRDRLPAAQIKYNREHYEQVLKTNRLWDERSDEEPNTKPDRLKVFRELQHSAIPAAKKAAIKSLLFTHSEIPELGNAFGKNGVQWAVSDIRIGREVGQRQQPIIYLRVQPTDYFTYRVIRECEDHIRRKQEVSQDRLAYKPNELRKYLEAESEPFQEFIHLGLGDVIFVQTMRDNKLVIRKRSARAANDKDSNRWAASANEGFKEQETYFVSDQHSCRLKPLKEIVDIALGTEIFADPPVGSRERNLIASTKEYWLTGILLYLPNMSLNLCFLVRTECTAKEAIDRALAARHRDEFVLSADQSPQLTVDGVGAFLREHITTKYASDTWDEGSLAALLMALRVPQLRRETHPTLALPAGLLWRSLLSRKVIVPIALLLVGIGSTVLGVSPPSFTIAHVCLSAAALMFMGVTVVWLAKADASKGDRILIFLVILGFIGAAWIWSYAWVSSRHRTNAQPQKALLFQSGGVATVSTTSSYEAGSATELEREVL
jgi:hypothetical protein